jgi:transcription elongation factor GreA
MKDDEMSANAAVRLTPEGWRKLHDELVQLRDRREAALSAQLQARQGATTEEVSESASTSEVDYLTHSISELEWVLARAEPVADEEREPGVIGVGAEVQVVWDDGDRETLIIVGPPEVSAREGRISYESPVGQALMGRRAGEQVWVATQAGLSRLEIDQVQ